MVYLVDERHESLTNLRLPIESVDSCEDRVLPAGCETKSIISEEHVPKPEIDHEFSKFSTSEMLPSPGITKDQHTSDELDDAKIEKLKEQYADYFSSIISRSKAKCQEDENLDDSIEGTEKKSVVENNSNDGSLSGNHLSFDLPSSDTTSDSDVDTDEVTSCGAGDEWLKKHMKDSHESASDDVSESSASNHESNNHQLPSPSPKQPDTLEEVSDSASFEKYESTRTELLKRIEETTEKISGGKSIVCPTSSHSFGSSSHQSPKPELLVHQNKTVSESRDDDALHFQNKVLREEVLRLTNELQYVTKEKNTSKEGPTSNDAMIPILTKQLMRTKQKLLKEQGTVKKLMQKMSLQRKKSEEKVEKLSNHILYLESLLNSHGIQYSRVSTNNTTGESSYGMNDFDLTPLARQRKNSQSLFSSFDDNDVRSTVSDMTDSVKDVELNPMNEPDLGDKKSLIHKIKKPKETIMEKIRRKYLCQDIDSVSDGGSLEGDKKFYQRLQ